MYDLLCQFESLIVLKSYMNTIDLNFIGTQDLDNIIEMADELGIDLNCIDYDNIDYNDQYKEICDVYVDWFDDVNTMYLDIKDSLFKGHYDDKFYTIIDKKSLGETIGKEILDENPDGFDVYDECDIVYKEICKQITDPLRNDIFDYVEDYINNNQN